MDLTLYTQLQPQVECLELWSEHEQILPAFNSQNGSRHWPRLAILKQATPDYCYEVAVTPGFSTPGTYTHD